MSRGIASLRPSCVVGRPFRAVRNAVGRRARQDRRGGATYRDHVAKPRTLEIAGREVTITNPDKVIFPVGGHTKLDLVHYYLAVADGALRGVAGRPMILKRFVKGIDE